MKEKGFVYAIIFGLFMLGLVAVVVFQKFELARQIAESKQMLETAQNENAVLKQELALAHAEIQIRKTHDPIPDCEIPEGDWDWLASYALIAKHDGEELRTVSGGQLLFNHLPVFFSVKDGKITARK